MYSVHSLGPPVSVKVILTPDFEHLTGWYLWSMSNGEWPQSLFILKLFDVQAETYQERALEKRLHPTLRCNAGHASWGTMWREINWNMQMTHCAQCICIMQMAHCTLCIMHYAVDTHTVCFTVVPSEGLSTLGLQKITLLHILMLHQMYYVTIKVPS